MTDHPPVTESPADSGGAGAPPSPGRPDAAPDLTRRYAADGITVEWYATRCIHSAFCIRSRPDVFDPRRRPWVEPALAPADEVAAAVLGCPTGALAFVRTDDGPQEQADVPTTLTPVPDGPVYARGDLELRGRDGAPLRATRLALCRCGLSAQMPRCDNACRAAGWHEPS